MSINYTAASEQAKRYLQKNQIDRAIALWTEFLPNAADNDTANALNNLGDLCARKKNNVAAIDHFLKASHAFETAGFPLKAIATLKKVIKLDPDRTEVYLRLGDLNARRDMIGNAVEAYLHVARLLVSQGEREEALAMVQKICILDPVNTRHRLQLAAELFELGFAEQAIDETINAVDLFLEAGNLEEAERYCRHLLDLKPGCEAAQERLERIARGGAAPRQSTAVPDGDPEAAIDQMFADLDLGDAPTAPKRAAERPPAPAPEPAPPADITPAPEGFTLDLEATQPPTEAEVDLRDLLETTSQSFGAGNAGADTGPSADFGEIPLELTSLSAEGGPESSPEVSPEASLEPSVDAAGEDAADPETLHREAVAHLDAGDLEAALDGFGRLVDAHLARGNPEAADAALGDYFSLDPDNPRAWEMRLRAVEGRDPEAERATLERLVALCRDSEPARAQVWEERLAALSGAAPEAPDAASGTPTLGLEVPEAKPEAPEGNDFMSISFSDLSDAAQAATEHIEVAPEGPAPEWSLDLPAPDAPVASVPAEAAPEADLQAHPQAHAADAPLDPSTLDLAASFRVPEAEGATASAIELEPAAAEEAEAVDVIPGLEVGGPGQAEVGATGPETPPAPEPRARPSRPAPAASSGINVKEALTEARFYERQELKDEAIQVYRNVLSHDPGNAEATGRLQALGVPVAHPAAPVRPAAGGRSAGGEADEFLDFTEAIEDTIEKEVSSSWRKVSEEAQFDEILDAFRKGIQAEVSDDDAETHYDLGLAYHEMGLTEEAIGEFQLAVKGVTRFADATIMLARCFSEMGKQRLAVSRLRTAVGRPDCGEAEWISLAYELGSALDAMGEKEEARQMYEEVYARDINYRDVAKRVSRAN
jgi:pilus assembly protein FimV